MICEEVNDNVFPFISSGTRQVLQRVSEEPPRSVICSHHRRRPRQVTHTNNTHTKDDEGQKKKTENKHKKYVKENMIKEENKQKTKQTKHAVAR